MTGLTEKSVGAEEEDDESLIICPPSHLQPAQQSKITRGKSGRVNCGRAARPGKRQAKSYLTKSSDEENVNMPPVLHPQPVQQSNTTRVKMTSVSKNKATRPARRRAKIDLVDKSSDENVYPHSAQQSMATRKRRLKSKPGVLTRQNGQQIRTTSESEDDSTSAAKRHKNTARRDSNVHVPSVGRFVTRRRCAVFTKPRLSKATVGVLNSSHDFSFGSSLVVHPSRRKGPSFLFSSAENSMNAALMASFEKIPLREISLNESTEQSLGPNSHKPIFCSTPSAASLSRRPRLAQYPTNYQASTSLSVSVSSITPLTTFQEDSPRQPLSPQHPVQPIVISDDSEQKEVSGLHNHEKPSADLLLELKKAQERSKISEASKSHDEDTQMQKGGELPSGSLLSTDNDSSSCFVSTTGGLEWLIEALKEKCLTQHCTVQLERLDFLTVTQLCSQTTYSSCLGTFSSICSPQTKDSHSMSNDHSIELLQSLESSVHVTNGNKLRSGSCSKSPLHESPPTNSQSTHHSSSDDCKQVSENTSTYENTDLKMENSRLDTESVCHTDSSAQFVIDMQLPTDSCFSVQEQFTYSQSEEVVTATKTKCRMKCTVKLKKLSQVTAEQLKWFTQHKEATVVCDKSVNPEANKCKNGHTPVRQSNSSAVSQTQTNDAESGEEAAVLGKVLKRKCLSGRLHVKINRTSPLELKDNLQLSDTSVKAQIDIPDSGSEDETKKDSKDTTMKKRRPTSPHDQIGLGEDLSKSFSVVQPPKRKKPSLAPKEKKRRSMSTDRPGTTRKACVTGLSVSRWKNNDVLRSRTAQQGGTKAVDCSINELVSTKLRQQREQVTSTMNFSTPAKEGNLNLSSLLADLTPNTHTWSRLKAALSVHHKGMVILTPRSLQLSGPGSPGRMGLADLSQDLFAAPRRTPLPKRLKSQLLSQVPQVVREDEDLSDAEKVYAECGQQGPLPWEECILPHRMKQCVKIGEGTFGEVFSTTNASGDTVALKIIPVEGSEKVNGEDQKTFGEILHEIIISKELSSLKEKQQNQTSGFIGLNDLHCVRGCYPTHFLNAWDNFDEQKGSENDRPDFFAKEQLFIILEFEFGGSDLENSNGKLASLGVAKSILHQVTAALAVAEQELHFEHRDLHWGNILVKTTKQKKGSFLLSGTAQSLETKGVFVRIIDYSLSRLEIDDLTVSCDISHDEELFIGQGDYQFDIYRLMRKENGNNWSDYRPHSNVLWLHYLCSKLLSMKYCGSGRQAKDTREELTRFYDNVLQYDSATEALQNCPMFQ